MDIHVLSQSADLKTFTVAFHIAIPALATNDAGVTYRDAIVAQGVEPSQVGDITTVEQAQLDAGELIESVTQVRWSTIGLSKADKLAELTAAYLSTKDAIRDAKTVELAYTGYATNV